METTQTVEEKPDFDKVRAAIQATNEQLRETERIIREAMKETDKRVGEITNRFGEMVEYMVVPNLVAKFRDLQFEFEKTHRDTVIASKEHTAHNSGNTAE